MRSSTTASGERGAHAPAASSASHYSYPGYSYPGYSYGGYSRPGYRAARGVAIHRARRH
jgi:hypothetical protein